MISAFIAFIARVVQSFGTHFVNIFVAIARTLALTGWIPLFLKFVEIDERIKKIIVIIISLPIFFIALAILYYYDQPPENHPVLEGEKAAFKIAHLVIALAIYCVVMGIIFLIRKILHRDSGENEE